jgi:hypothetical protein
MTIPSKHLLRSPMPDGYFVIVSMEISIALTLMIMFHMFNKMNLKHFIGLEAGYRG